MINLPKEDLSSVERICFQVEEAQWFYEDFIRPLDPSLPSMSLRTFCLRIFQHCPLLAAFTVDNHMRAFEEFLMYKNRVPVRGAIMLNHEMDSVVLVKGWKKTANWSFPRGKISKDEDDLDCAIREVYEETGFDIRAAGLVPEPGKAKYIDIPMKEQHLRLYVFRDVPMDTHFEPRTRKEISRIEWYKLSDLPAFRKKNVANSDQVEVAKNANKFFMVAPFLVPLKKWVQQQKLADAKKIASNEGVPAYVEDVPTDVHTDQEDGFRSTTEASTSRHPSDASSQVLNTMEGATAALKQLLRIQPATQGLQQQAPAGQPAATGNTGKDLLALLRGNPQVQRPVAPQHAPQPQYAQAPAQQMPSANGPSNPPQTPLEALLATAQMPPNPHPIHSGRRVLSANCFGQPPGAPPQIGGPPQIAGHGQYQMRNQPLPTPSFCQPNNVPTMELGAQAPPASQLPPPQPQPQPNVMPSQEIRNPQLQMPVRSVAPQQPSVPQRPGQSRDIRSGQFRPHMPPPKNVPIRPVAILARPPPGRRGQTPDLVSNAAAQRRSASPPRPDVYDMQRRADPPAPQQLPPVPVQKADLPAMFKNSSRNATPPGSVPPQPEQKPVAQRTAAPPQPQSSDLRSMLRGSDKGLVAAQAGTPQQKPITPQQKSALLSIFNAPGRQVASPQAAPTPSGPSQQRTDLSSMFQPQRKPSLGPEPKQDLLRMLNVQSPKASPPVPQQPKVDIRSHFQAPEHKLSFGALDKNKNDLLAMLQNRTPKAATPDTPKADPFSKFQAPERKLSFGLEKGDLLSMLKGKSPQPPAPAPVPTSGQAPAGDNQKANLLKMLRGNSTTDRMDLQSMFRSPELKTPEVKSPEQQKSNLLALLKGNGVPPPPQQQPQQAQYGVSMMQNGLSQQSFGQQNAYGAENRVGPLPPFQNGGMVGQQQQSLQAAPRGLPEHKSHLLNLFNGQARR